MFIKAIFERNINKIKYLEVSLYNHGMGCNSIKCSSPKRKLHHPFVILSTGKMTTSSATSDKNPAKTITLPPQWHVWVLWKQYRRHEDNPAAAGASVDCHWNSPRYYKQRQNHHTDISRGSKKIADVVPVLIIQGHSGPSTSMQETRPGICQNIGENFHGNIHFTLVQYCPNLQIGTLGTVSINNGIKPVHEYPL